MENQIDCSKQATIKIATYIDKIGVLDKDYDYNKKIHYIDAPASGFRLALFMTWLEHKGHI